MATSENLKAAFAGESQANRSYLAFSRQADSDGWKQIAKLFRAVAEAETIHALAHLRVMGGIKDTAGNVQTAMNGEAYEFTEMYPKFLAAAEQENNKQAALSFKYAMAVEKIHHLLYTRALEALKNGSDLPETQIHICPVCGNTVIGEVTGKCDICGVAKEKFIEVY